MKHKIKLIKMYFKNTPIEVYDMKSFELIKFRYYNDEFKTVSMYDLSYTKLSYFYGFEIDCLCLDIKQKLKLDMIIYVESKIKKELSL